MNRLCQKGTRARAAYRATSYAEPKRITPGAQQPTAWDGMDHRTRLLIAGAGIAGLSALIRLLFVITPVIFGQIFGAESPELSPQLFALSDRNAR